MPIPSGSWRAFRSPRLGSSKYASAVSSKSANSSGANRRTASLAKSRARCVPSSLTAPIDSPPSPAPLPRRPSIGPQLASRSSLLRTAHNGNAASSIRRADCPPEAGGSESR
ncbi:hypothetical protein GCM10010341_38070 [Streptomyces noursei]|nr:hypothetical protein GCM10010341_38070 [Streptomyces noursei]